MAWSLISYKKKVNQTKNLNLTRDLENEELNSSDEFEEPKNIGSIKNS